MKRWYTCLGCEVMWCDETAACWICSGPGTPSPMPELRGAMHFKHDDDEQAAS